MLNSYLTILGVDRNFSVSKLMSLSIAFVVMLSHSFSSSFDQSQGQCPVSLSLDAQWMKWSI